jgi:ABC-2 type transport system permease protein
MQHQKTRRSLRALALALVAIILCVAVNVAVQQVPTRYTKFDTSEDSFITLSDQSHQIVSSLTKDVTLYWLVTAGSENETISLLLDRYADESDHVTVEKVDLTLNPEFGQQYTTKTIFENSVIVDAGDRSEYVSYYKIYNYDDSDYLTTGQMTITFEGESKLTNAIHRVTSDSTPTVYVLSGHGETELSDTLQDNIADENLSIETLTLLSVDAVPDDCAVLFIVAPTVDLSDDDTEKIRTYLDNGGNMMLITNNVGTDELPNLRTLMEEDYGVGLLDGIVLEGSEYYYVSQPYHLLPNLRSHEITNPLIDGNLLVIVPFAQPMKIMNDLPSYLTVTSLLTTTDASYCKADGYNLTTLEQSDDDMTGPFTVGAAIESTKGTKIVWIPSVYFLEDSVDSQVSGGNTNLLLNALSWMCGQVESISIRTRMVADDYFTVSTAVSRNFAIVFIAVIPLAVLAVGAGVYVRRRRR